jgi:hypothetical protein
MKEVRDSQVYFLIREIHKLDSKSIFIPEEKAERLHNKLKDITLPKYKYLLSLCYANDKQMVDDELTRIL